MTSQTGADYGSAFLLNDSAASDLFTREDLTEEHRAISDTVNSFWNNEIEPQLKHLLDRKPGFARRLMRKASEIGLMAVSIPERFGGMELDLISALVVAEGNARDASYMIWEGGHNTIGTLPIVYFGTEDQKARYLPALARVDLVSAYALTEPQAGSDALAVQTRAALADSGTEYVLNGQKMWISNASEADIFTVFAKVDGEAFTAFLIDRNSTGLRVGAEERKMGLRGSSTTALYLDNVRVPISNVLGEVGRGHVIAFNILNLGRLKMGASAIGAAKDVLRLSLSYAKQRQAFGCSISEFGAIRHKLAEMAVRIFATESIVWRTAGRIRKREGDVTWSDPDAARIKLEAVREFAIECSIVKVFGSEMLDYVVDEGVQIHGGYGYHEDYTVEKAYRDSRINRIFEGTNEINRLLVLRMLLKRASKGLLPLFDAVDDVMRDPDGYGAKGQSADRSAHAVPIRRAKAAALLTIGLARKAFPNGLEGEQELLMLIADIIIDVYAMESTLLRTAKIADRGAAGTACHMAAVFSEEALLRISSNARHVIGACSHADESGHWVDALTRLLSSKPADLIRHRQAIARSLLEREHYVV